MAIPYISGFPIKPSEIGDTGIVIFTDGTNTVIPNQKQCEAYGYTYDKTTGTCKAFTYSQKFRQKLSKY